MAFTITVSSSKIDVTAGTGTLADLYTDAIAVTAGCMTNPSAQTYQVEGNRELELSSGVFLSTTDGDTLQWALTANGYPVLDVASGARLDVAQNTTFIGDTDNTHQSYFYFYGETNFNGTSGNEIVIENYRTVYIQDYGNVTGASDGIHTWDYVILRDVMSSSGHSLYFRPDIYQLDADNGQHSFTNITIDMSAGPNSAWGQLYFDSGDYSRFTFDNFTMTEGNRIICYGCSNLKIANSTFTDGANDNRCYHSKEGNITGRYNPAAASYPYPQQIQNQSKVLFQNCTFDGNDNGVYAGLWQDRGGVVFYDDCTFQNATYGTYSNRGIALYTGTTTFTTITTNRRWGNGGTHFHCRKLNLTVEDSLTNPIADAVVQVRQKEGREHWQFMTDSNGQVLDIHDEPPWLVEREETATGVFTEWSDGTGDQVHVLEVFKDGFTAHSQEIAFTSDQTLTVTLETAPPGSTKIYGSTFYGSNIY